MIDQKQDLADRLLELYGAAVDRLVCASAGLRERLREAFGELEHGRKLLIQPANEDEPELENLRCHLAESRRLDLMAADVLPQIAGEIFEAYKDAHALVIVRNTATWEEMNATRWFLDTVKPSNS